MNKLLIARIGLCVAETLLIAFGGDWLPVGATIGLLYAIFLNNVNDSL